MMRMEIAITQAAGLRRVAADPSTKQAKRRDDQPGDAEHAPS